MERALTYGLPTMNTRETVTRIQDTRCHARYWATGAQAQRGYLEAYHGLAFPNLRSVLEVGLRASTDPRRHEFTLPAFYCTPSLKAALYYALHATFQAAHLPPVSTTWQAVLHVQVPRNVVDKPFGETRQCKAIPEMVIVLGVYLIKAFGFGEGACVMDLEGTAWVRGPGTPYEVSFGAHACHQLRCV